MPWRKECFPRVRVVRKLPVVLDYGEVAGFFDYIPSLKYRAGWMHCCETGLRIVEAAAIKVSDVDSKCMPIRVEQGEGNKDRCVTPSVYVLRRYRRAGWPRVWLFPFWRENKHLSADRYRLTAGRHPDNAASPNESPPYSAPFLRHSSSRKRRRYASVPGAPGHSRIDTTALYTRVSAHLIAGAPSPLNSLRVKPKPKSRK
jgi:integrase